MKEKVLRRHNDSVYGVQISPLLPQDKNEFVVVNDCMVMASPLHAAVLGSGAGTECFASVLPLSEKPHVCRWALRWQLSARRGQRAHCLLDWPPSDLSHAGKAVGIFH